MFLSGDPGNGLILYVAAYAFSCLHISSPVFPFLPLNISHTLAFFLFLFPGVWVPGRFDMPGQYGGFPASHPHHPFLQHCALWEADPDACILVSYLKLFLSLNISYCLFKMIGIVSKRSHPILPNTNSTRHLSHVLHA